MNDRRNYSRLFVTRSIMVYINGLDTEIKGILTDISESGIGIDIDIKDVPDTLSSKYTAIKFQFFDAYPLGKHDECNVIQGNAVVVRIVFMGNKCHLGCIVRDNKFKEYVLKRKLSDYLDYMS